VADQKTKPTDVTVDSFLNAVPDPKRQQDAFALLELMKKAMKCEPKMWGPSIVGFGSYHYKYESGREGDSCLLGFSPRKDSLVLYLSSGHESIKKLLEGLGKHKMGKGCLYIKKLEDVDTSVLAKILKEAATTSPPSAVTVNKKG
jgi:hypothetical protein